MANQSMEQKRKQDDQGGELLYCGPTDWDAVAKGDYIVYSQLKESCLRTPTRLSALTAITIRSVASGCAANHCVALDTQGRCYTWGLNGKGQLGHGDTNTRHSPTLVASLSDRTIVKAASGKRHTVLLTDTGESFAFGWNNYGQLGTGSHKNETVSSPERCFAPETTHTVACGSMFTVWVTATEGMSIMTAGMPQYGVLGHGTDGLYNTKTTTIHLDFYPNPTPRAIKALAEKTITKVACGVNHTVAVDSEGFVYTWGCGNYGALGHGVQKDEWLPRVVEFFQRRMLLPSDAVVVSGNACSACTVTGGQMYMWGKWSRLSAADAWMKPRPLMTISGWNIRCIDFGTWGSMCGAEQSCISWGQSILGGLGFGSDGKGSSNHPDKVNALEGMHVLDVACGFGHSLIVVDRTNMHHRIQQLGVHGGGETDIDVKEEVDEVGLDSSLARGKKRKATDSVSKATKVTNKEVTPVRKSKRVKVAESSKAAAKNGKMIEVEESSKASVKNGKKLKVAVSSKAAMKNGKKVKVAESSKAAMKNGKKVKVAESSKAAMKKKGKKKAAVKNGKKVPAVKGQSKANTSTTSNKSNTQSIPKPRGRGKN